MKWTRGHRSSFVEDRRGRSRGRRGGRRVAVGGGFGVVALLVAVVFGRDYLGFFDQDARYSDPRAGRPGYSQSGPGGAGIDPKRDPDAELVEFVSFVLDDAQATWQRVFADQLDRRYQPARLVLFTDAIDSACGYSSAAIGPFYCPADRKAYIDLGFYRTLRQRLGAPGDFAQAYVIAHELGHHVQNLLGTSRKVHRERRRLSEAKANALSVRLELQADCLAGVWAHSTGKRDLLERGDISEALTAAQAIGDDTLQKRATGKVMPETWTHGSSAQRMRWFKRGFDSGEVERCDTFSAASL